MDILNGASYRLMLGDARHILTEMPDASVNCFVTSPPYYGLRRYLPNGDPNQQWEIGQEESVPAYVSSLVETFREARRVLTDDGTLWLNLGDTYASAWPCPRRNVVGNKSLSNGKREARPPRLGQDVFGGELKEKDLIGIPWEVAFALRRDGWYLRMDVVWEKPNPMPGNVKDRPMKAHEYIFLLTKSPQYYYDHLAIQEPLAAGSAKRYDYAFGGAKNKQLKATDNRTAIVGERAAPTGRNKRSVWRVNVARHKGTHFAVFPEELIEPCIMAGCPVGGIVIDPFVGSGTTGVVALKHGRRFVGIDLNPEYVEMSEQRLQGVSQLREAA